MQNLETRKVPIELMRKSRDEVIQSMDNMTSLHLSHLLRGLGAPNQETKGPRAMLIDRILWRMFDFEAGHNLILSGNATKRV